MEAISDCKVRIQSQGGTSSLVALTASSLPGVCGFLQSTAFSSSFFVVQNAVFAGWFTGGLHSVPLFCSYEAVVNSYLARHPQLWVEELPPFAPELNPEEYCHGTVKKRLRNLNPDNAYQIRRHLNAEFARLRNQPQLLLDFFHHAGLALKQLW